MHDNVPDHTGRIEETDMAERARSGDTEAFGELIRRHRHGAYRFAASMARNPDLAEDIVQEALTKAFLHVGKLADPDRFAAWLKQIVRNEANMKLRRGGPHRREQPMSGFMESGSRPQAGFSSNGEAPDAHNRRLGDQAVFEEGADDPAQVLLRQERLQSLRSLLSCLNERERDIFEAAFFLQFSAGEIAEMFGTTPGSVHTYLYRSRQKIRQSALSAESRLDSIAATVPVMRKNSVNMPAGVLSVRHTLIDRLGKLLRARGTQVSADELMGRTCHAFRLKLSTRTTYADGAFVFDWMSDIGRAAAAYGYEAVFLTGQLEGTPVPLYPVAMQFAVERADSEAVISFIRPFIDCGSPVLFFDTYVGRPFVHEWNVIYGYNDMERTVQVTDVSPPYRKTLAYEQVAASPLRFLCALRSRAKRAPREPIPATLQRIVAYAREGDGYRGADFHSNYASGVNAYRTWIRHLQAGPRQANAYGHKYLAYVHADARNGAAGFLRSLDVEKCMEGQVWDAAACYEEAAGYLRRVSDLHPFHGKSDWTETSLQTAVSWLEQTAHAEEQAVLHLESAIRIWNEKSNLIEEQTTDD